jgi:putative SOS response-associated peptidase YedK
MCNEYEQKATYAIYLRMMQEIGLGTPTGETEADLRQADSIRISDPGTVMRGAGNGIALTGMRFGFPARAGSGPVFNWRSEGRKFAESNRCLIPTTAFFEFTGAKSPKTKHRFSLKDSPMMAIAGIWKPGPQPDAALCFAMLTTEPGPDVSPYHDRQIVVLRPEDWPHWIHLSKPEAELLKPLPAGSLEVETVRRGRNEQRAVSGTLDL